MFICDKTNTTRERFYDNVTTTIHDVNLNLTDDGNIFMCVYIYVWEMQKITEWWRT